MGFGRSSKRMTRVTRSHAVQACHAALDPLPAPEKQPQERKQAQITSPKSKRGRKKGAKYKRPLALSRRKRCTPKPMQDRTTHFGAPYSKSNGDKQQSSVAEPDLAFADAIEQMDSIYQMANAAQQQAIRTHWSQILSDQQQQPSGTCINEDQDDRCTHPLQSG
ncbi:hypothetical protein WJX84_008540 [Apatococcus fuscideae]|uniref:Uncharacterized protein n=1 Tax=Apatococcus fuscideae TaxID=2026836 RepID=A0AAW1SSM6_9CHLO